MLRYREAAVVVTMPHVAVVVPVAIAHHAGLTEEGVDAF